MDKGPALNQRVWKLFEKAGFSTEPNSSSASEHAVQLAPGKNRNVDLYAHDPNLKALIIGSNKAGGWKESWSAHVNDWEQICKKANADTVLFVITGKEISPEDSKYARDKGFSIWTEDELSYYEAVAEAIGEYAKYEIIHALGINTKEEKSTHRVLV